MYEYLIGNLGLGLMWLFLYIKNNNLRKEMIYGGILYVSIIAPTIIITKLLSYFTQITWRYVPDYFNPHTLFNLSRKTGILSIEDILFMFLAGGIIVTIYEIIFKKEIIKTHKKHHILALISFFSSYIIIALIFSFNPIYNLIISSFIGFLVITFQRSDLIKHSVYGGIAFTVLWFILVILFNIVFPNVLQEGFWNLNNISGILMLKVPIEELLYAFTFGLMFAPMYEYIKGYKN
ncbi:hypothetical protein CL617_04015 [archaeon]|nr:hypothetical protein [archaeon]